MTPSTKLFHENALRGAKAILAAWEKWIKEQDIKDPQSKDKESKETAHK